MWETVWRTHNVDGPVLNLSFYHVIAVLIKCSVQASVDSMVFSTWIHSDNTQIAVGRLDNIATNWKFKPMTCLQDKINVSLCDCAYVCYVRYIRYRILLC